MFNDRDLGVLGAGALLSVSCLLLPVPFAGKVALGFGVLVGFMVLAFLRLGPDRIPLEEWLRRRVRYRWQARRYTYQQGAAARRQSWRMPRRRPGWSRWREAGARPSEPVPAVARPMPTGRLHPIAFALDEVQVYPLVTLLLGVVGIYLLAWLAEGGVEEIGMLFGGVLR